MIRVRARLQRLIARISLPVPRAITFPAQAARVDEGTSQRGGVRMEAAQQGVDFLLCVNQARLERSSQVCKDDVQLGGLCRDLL